MPYATVVLSSRVSSFDDSPSDMQNFDLSTSFRLWLALKQQIDREICTQDSAEAREKIASLARAQTRLVELSADMANLTPREVRLELEVWLKAQPHAANDSPMREQDVAAVEALLAYIRARRTPDASPE